MAETGWAELITLTTPGMSGSISAFRLTGFGDLPLLQLLYDRYKITTPVSTKADTLTQRVSTHFYNSFEQIDSLLECLTELRQAKARQ